MPRSRGGSGPSRSSARAPPSRPASTARTRTPPTPAPAPPPPASAPTRPQGGGIMSGLMGTMMSGAAFGSGSAVAHKAVNAAADSVSSSGGSDKKDTTELPPPQCGEQSQHFMDCLKASNNNAAACAEYFDALQSCQSQANSLA